MLQNAAPRRKSAPGPPNMSDSCVSTPRKMHLSKSSSMRHNRMHFFDSSTSKSAPTLRCFVHFDFEICFRATPACTFSTAQLPKALRHWGASYILTSKSASRHTGVHFFDISSSKSALTLVCVVRFHFEMCNFSSLISCRFSEPTFRSARAPNTLFRDFSTFSRTCIFFLLTLFLLLSSFFFSSFLWLFPPLLFHPSILSEVWLLNFLRVYQCLHHNDAIWYQSCDAWWVSLYYDVYILQEKWYITGIYMFSFCFQYIPAYYLCYIPVISKLFIVLVLDTRIPSHTGWKRFPTHHNPQ